MRASVALLLVGALLAAGCAAPSDERRTVRVDPPEGEGGWAPCASASAIPLPVPFEAVAVEDSAGRAPGIHRLDNDTFLWVWAVYFDTLREDRVSRVNEVRVEREPDGTRAVCTRVELVAPTQVDEQRRSYAVAVRLHATDGFPQGPARVVVNWVAGCPGCSPLPMGNTTASFGW